MEAFANSLKNVHDKLCKGNVVHRDPSHIRLPVDKYPVPFEELDEMFDLIIEVPQEEILGDNKVYDMVQDVISCMRDTGMIDNYLFLMFMEGTNTFQIASMFKTTIINSTIKYDHQSRSEKLFRVEDRIDNIMNIMSLRDPFHIENDNKRYGDMDELLSRMEAIVKSVKLKYDQEHDKEKTTAEIEKKARDLVKTNTVAKEMCEESDGDTSAVSESSDDEGV